MLKLSVVVLKMKCPECDTECQFGGPTKNGWELVSILIEKDSVKIGSHFDHWEIGGHCHTHKISKKKFEKFLRLGE